VLLFNRDREPRVLLTERPGHLRNHPGQISFPGGKWEPEDRDLWDTARREAREEIGLQDPLQLLGCLDQVEVRVSNYIITPFVAWTDAEPHFSVDPFEVGAIIEVPLRAVLDPLSVAEEEWEFRGTHWHVSLFRFGEHIVWGATARILSDLVARVKGSPGEHVHAPGSVRPVQP
jgi:8-oxo-dGTP pyrophosphatase MutT (NUDIX family)